uniref:Arylformamidase n=1 Tax=Rhinolophus ferrumequinum TaxID=59479 RepID=A0A671FV31_RHIFE
EMGDPDELRKGEAPWKKMSKEELERQYTPSRWVVRLGAEEALRTYSQIGNEALPFCMFLHGGYWQSGRRCAEQGGKPRLKKCLMWITLKSFGN